MPNVVAALCGGRGSGKTLSMSVEAGTAMVSGMNCFSNIPIEFDFEWPDGKVTHHKSIPIEIEDLISFRPDIRDGVICLDELNLWVSNRGAMTIINRLLNSWCQLIRKRNLNVFITVQAFESLDKMIRWQTDLTVQCQDLSYKYSDLKEGAYISQKLTDWSGVFTGNYIYSYREYDKVEANTRYRMLHGQPFWGIYDSWSEVDIIKAMTQYKVDRDVKIIGQLPNSMVDMFKGLKESGFESGNVFTKDELYSIARQWGYEGGDRQLGRSMEDLGFKKTTSGYVMP